MASRPTPSVRRALIEPGVPPTVPGKNDEKDVTAGGDPSVRVRQGARDLTRGVQDTTRGPEADAAYKRLKKP
jgi:hypothetical protein